MDHKKNPSKTKARIEYLEREVARLRSRSLQLEGDRIQMTIRYTDLMSNLNSVSATYISEMRQRDETLHKLLAPVGIGRLDLANEEQVRRVALRTADKAVQTDLW